MPDHSIQQASELPGEERLIVERWLGRTVANDETISINAYRPHVSPEESERQSLRRDIVAQAHEIGSRADINDPELEDLLGEAFDIIRGRRG